MPSRNSLYVAHVKQRERSPGRFGGTARHIAQRGMSDRNYRQHCTLFTSNEHRTGARPANSFLVSWKPIPLIVLIPPLGWSIPCSSVWLIRPERTVEKPKNQSRSQAATMTSRLVVPQSSEEVTSLVGAVALAILGVIIVTALYVGR